LIRWSVAALAPFLLAAQSYDWPIPDDVPRWINGTFCECRSSGSVDRHHFHDGIDIHLPRGREVYSVITGTVTSIGTASQYGINSWIRVGRYAYVHVDANPTLAVGDSVYAYQTIVGATNSWNHIHFKDGYPGSERNPIRQGGGLTPINDIYSPSVLNIRFYPYNSEQEFLQQKVFGRIDIVTRAMDRTDSGPIGDNNGIYSIGYRILDSTGAVVAGQIPFTFDYIPSSDSYTPIVYAPGSNTSTYIYEVTNILSQDRYLDVSHWSPGNYTAQVFTWDPYGLNDTTSVSFQVAEQDTTPPALPTLLSARAVGESFRLTWAPVPEPDLLGYRLYFSYDGESWHCNHREDVLTQETTSLSAPTFGSGIDIYFHITAVDDAPYPNESDPSDTYGLRRSVDEPRVLIVDSFDRSDGGWSRPSHDFMMEIGLRLGMGFDTIADEFFQTDSLSFADYDVVIIHDGDDLSALDQAFSVRYLTSDPASRVRWYMGTRLLDVWPAANPGWQGELPPAASGPVPLPDTLTMHWGGTYDLRPSLGRWQPDSLMPIDDQYFDRLNVDGAGRVFGVTDGNGKVVTALPLEVMGGAGLLDTVMARFQEILPIFQVEDNPPLAQCYFVSAYPNPFNLRVSLQVALPRAAEVEIGVFNLLGREIWRGREAFPSGVSYFVLPGQAFQQAGSGVYFLRTTYLADDISQNTKILKVTYLK